MRSRAVVAAQILVGSLTILSGCALKDPPDHAQVTHDALPNVPIPEAWQSAAGAGGVEDQWLATFADATLDALVAEAIFANPDMRITAARVEQAAAQLKAAGSYLLPAVGALGRTGGKLGGDFTGTSGVLFKAVWEGDVWGRVRYGNRAARETFFSVADDLAAARQSLVGLIAKAWFLAIESRLQRDIARQVVADSERLVSVAEDRARVGSGNDLDTTLAEQTLQTSRDALAQIELAYVQAVRAVELLVGRYPAAALEPAAVLDALADAAPAGLPSELLERRLDVMAAEHRIRAAFSNVEAARAARLPTISLSAGISHITSDLFQLQKRDDWVKSVGGTSVLPIFDGGYLKAQVEARTAEQREALALWAKVGLNAFSEVESALAAEASLREREPILSKQLDLSQHALDLEQVRYRVGATDLRTVLQQQMVVYSVRTSLLRVQSEQRVQRVNLYLALGGDFGIEQALATANAMPH